MAENASNGDTAIRVDIVSDVVCPWCIVGYKQLERALIEAGLAGEIHWHPFELNPQMAEEGENLRDHLAAKYGTSPEDSVTARQRLTALGAELGFTFNYADDMRMYNTFRAHQLLHWAGTHGRKHALKLALFGAFFGEGRNIGDPRILADRAADVGLDRSEALSVLEDGRFADTVRQQEHFWTSRGVHGVPAMVFQGRYLATGAQGTENYMTVLRQVAEQHASGGPALAD